MKKSLQIIPQILLRSTLISYNSSNYTYGSWPRKQKRRRPLGNVKFNPNWISFIRRNTVVVTSSYLYVRNFLTVIMDLSQQIRNTKKEERESEIRSKKLFEVTIKKVKLEKAINDAKLKLKEKEDELSTWRTKSIVSDTEVLVVKKKVDIAKYEIKELLEKIVHAENKTKITQEMFWKRINDFVSEGNRYLEKGESRLGNIKKKVDGNIRNQERNNLLKAEGQLDAVRLYEKYQSRKIEELNFIKKVMETG